MATSQDSMSPASYGTAPPTYTSSVSALETRDEKIVDTSPTPVRASSSYIDDGGLPEVVVPVQETSADEIAKASKTTMTAGESNPETPTTEISNPTKSVFDNEETVTPLRLLGDQPDTVDCPFCRRRTETRVKKTASNMTHIAATGLFLTTLGGVVAPYARNWKSNVSHYCTNCDRKVAYRRYNEDTMTALGTPEHLREVSRYPAANKS